MKRLIGGSILIFTLGLLFVFGIEVSAKTIQKEVVVLEGATRSVSMDSSDVENLKVKGKKYAAAKAKAYKIVVTGKKKGNATITFKLPEQEIYYKIKVKVLSVKKVKAKSKKQLKKYLQRTGKGTKYIYADLNQDGIQELYLSKKIVYYDYVKNEICTEKHNYKTIYTSPKTKKIYVIYRKPRKTDEFVYFSGIYEPKTSKVFGLKDTGKGFREYTEKGLKEYAVENPYSFYDYYYDQDDYEYESLTEEQMKERLEELIPDATALKWKKTKS